MLILYTIMGLIIYIFIVFIIGKTNLKEKVKKYFLLLLSAIYNFFIGYIDTYVILLLYAFFINQPNGGGYEVAKLETGFNMIIGIVILIIYLLLLIPINIYAKKKGKINTKIYMITNVVVTLIGIIVFLILSNKNQKLF